MSTNYISDILIHDLRHLQQVHIPGGTPQAPHLILTGPNGSGKTLLLDALAAHLDIIKKDTKLTFLNLPTLLRNAQQRVDQTPPGSPEHTRNADYVRRYTEMIRRTFGQVEARFPDCEFITRYAQGDFIIAYYRAARRPIILEPSSPTHPAPHAADEALDTVTGQFVNYLSDLKIHEALLRAQGDTAEADRIDAWFRGFVALMRRIYADPELTVDFDYTTYRFHIHTCGKSFRFTELAAGFAAVLDIVLDLILKMQRRSPQQLATLDVPGIVLIDEIETHLHLSLQKNVLPILTALFPAVQFIVSTHSPFVLSSLPDATAYDLERRISITDLTRYSYQALAEGYFGVSGASSYARLRLDQLAALLGKDAWTDAERSTARHIVDEFGKIPEPASPSLTAEFRQLLIRHSDKLQALQEEP